MLKTIIKLIGADGRETQIAPDAVSGTAVQSATVTECVNNGEELTLGSACASALEVTLFTPEGALPVTAGSRVAVYKEQDVGVQTRVGEFTLEKPTRPTANTIKLTGYDNVSRLDKDMTGWLAAYYDSGESDTLLEFARKVCAYCGVNLVDRELVPNGAFFMPKFTCSSVTGRQLMQWIGEVCCKFCRANANGGIEFGWYQPSGKEIAASGELYYFKNGLTYESYATGVIDAVLVGSGNGETALSDGLNCYVINGNPILNALEEGRLAAVTGSIRDALSGFCYVPCKVSIPANLSIHAGQTVDIVDKNGSRITTCVMTKTQTGQTDTLESTGSYRRDSTAAVNNQSAQQKTAQMDSKVDFTLVNAKAYADGAAAKAKSDAEAFAATELEVAMRTLDRAYIVKKLTNEGKLAGIYEKDGKWHIDAELVQVENLIAQCVESKLGDAALKIADAVLHMVCGKYEIMKMEGGAGSPTLRMRQYDADEIIGQSLLTAHGLGFGCAAEGALLQIGVDAQSKRPYIMMPENGEANIKTIGWKDNGDGTFTLKGE